LFATAEKCEEHSFVKDIILWQSVAAREREEKYLRTLASLHQSVTPPSELLLPVPRKLHWKRTLKFIVGFDAVLLAFAICMMIKLCALESTSYKDVATESRRHLESLHREAAHTPDLEKKAKIEKSIRDDEKFGRRWRLIHVAILVGIFGIVLVGPVTHVTLNWFIHIRPDLILLRSGVPARATVVGRKRWLLATYLEMGFTTERGESIRKKQIVREREAELFQAGSPAWMLYCPSRPSRARIYGLRSALAEVVP
jgi:hypothetical protein